MQLTSRDVKRIAELYREQRSYIRTAALFYNTTIDEISREKISVIKDAVLFVARGCKHDEPAPKFMTMENIIVAAKYEAMYQMSRSHEHQARDDWASEVGSALASATDNVWCDGYCESE